MSTENLVHNCKSAEKNPFDLKKEEISVDQIRESTYEINSCGSSCNSESSITTNTSSSGFDDRSRDFDDESNSDCFESSTERDQLNEKRFMDEETKEETNNARLIQSTPKIVIHEINKEQVQPQTIVSLSNDSLIDTTINSHDETNADDTIISSNATTSCPLINDKNKFDSYLDENETLLSGSCDAEEVDEDELIYRHFLPKKSCLVIKSKLFIDTNNDSGAFDYSANATSSPLQSPTQLSSMSLLGSPNSASSIQQSSLSVVNSSLSNSSTLSVSSLSTSLSSSSSSSSLSSSSKKRVSFADSCGKDLCSVRTMNEPSNCPPKLTSKIVQYFLNRELNNPCNNLLNNNNFLSNTFQSFGGFNSAPNRFNECGQPIYTQQASYPPSKPFFPASNSYDYGISGLTYTNDISQLSGSIAVYSLNFAQPAGDYLLFRQRLDENSVSLENVLLNRFLINGTIKVKNINFHKHVFVRCTFNNWSSYEDYQALYVPSEFYSSQNIIASPTSSSISATFYGTNNVNYQPLHKEYDTFRFEFELPKTVERSQQSQASNTTGSIKFCICYKSGTGSETKEFWDSNGGKNYEILQYVIDIESLKGNNRQKPQSQSNNSNANKQNYFKYEISSQNSSNKQPTNFSDNGIYY